MQTNALWFLLSNFSGNISFRLCWKLNEMKRNLINWIFGQIGGQEPTTTKAKPVSLCLKTDRAAEFNPICWCCDNPRWTSWNTVLIFRLSAQS